MFHGNHQHGDFSFFEMITHHKLEIVAIIFSYLLVKMQLVYLVLAGWLDNSTIIKVDGIVKYLTAIMIFTIIVKNIYDIYLKFKNRNSKGTEKGN